MVLIFSWLCPGTVIALSKFSMHVFYVCGGWVQWLVLQFKIKTRPSSDSEAATVYIQTERSIFEYANWPRLQVKRTGLWHQHFLCCLSQLKNIIKVGKKSFIPVMKSLFEWKEILITCKRSGHFFPFCFNEVIYKLIFFSTFSHLRFLGATSSSRSDYVTPFVILLSC